MPWKETTGSTSSGEHLDDRHKMSVKANTAIARELSAGAGHWRPALQPKTSSCGTNPRI
ncbi:hypothetical protein ARTHRO9V_160138 [Arthrobacter sp. 9V]|nr:hypothetical protein ARTHRO9V_160138 [Arthrobacter sp. 9V]